MPTPDWLADLCVGKTKKSIEGGKKLSTAKAETKAKRPPSYIASPSEKPIARISIIAEQQCLCCGSSVRYVWLEGVRFRSGQMHSRRDAVSAEGLYSLPHIIEALAPELVPQCAQCLRAESTLDELFEPALSRRQADLFNGVRKEAA